MKLNNYVISFLIMIFKNVRYKLKRRKFGLTGLPSNLNKLLLYFPEYEFSRDYMFPLGVLRVVADSYGAFANSLLPYLTSDGSDSIIHQDIQILNKYKETARVDLQEKLSTFMPKLIGTSHEFASMMARARTIGMTSEINSQIRVALNSIFEFHINNYLPFVDQFQSVFGEGWKKERQFPHPKTNAPNTHFS